MSIEQSKLTGPAVIDWVFHHLPQSGSLSPRQSAALQEEMKSAPSGAPSLLEWARSNREEFYKLWSARIAKMQIEQEAKVSDNGEPVLQLIEKLEAALGLVPQASGADGVENQPGVPQETTEISADQF